MDYAKNDVVDMFDRIMAECDTNYSQTASKITRNGKPMVRQSLYKSVKGGAIKVSTLFEILDMLDVDLVLRKAGKVIYGREPRF